MMTGAWGTSHIMAAVRNCKETNVVLRELLLPCRLMWNSSLWDGASYIQLTLFGKVPTSTPRSVSRM